VQAVQVKLRKEIEGKKIIIESNPTSNVLISNIKGYDEHPMFVLRRPNSHIGCQFEIGLGTDDKGILATSIDNEYALIGTAMKERKQDNGQMWNDSSIEKYLKGIAGASM
jgi:adenosine deaminase